MVPVGEEEEAERDELRRLVMESLPSSSSSSSSSRRRFSDRRSGGVRGMVGLDLELDGDVEVEVGVAGDVASDLSDCGEEDARGSRVEGLVSIASSSSSG